MVSDQNIMFNCYKLVGHLLRRSVYRFDLRMPLYQRQQLSVHVIVTRIVLCICGWMELG